MKLLHSLPVVGILAVVAFSPIAASAQAASSDAGFYPSLRRPAISSSSSLSESYFAAPAPAAASSSSAAPAAPATDEGGPFSGIGAGFKLGVAGIGFDVATPIVPTRLNLRGGATFFSYNLSDTTSDGETRRYPETPELRNHGGLVPISRVVPP